MASSSSSTRTSRVGLSSSAARAKAPVRRKRNRAGRPTADELERRKDKVMVVATDMFVKRGYAATTLLDIAKKAGVATRTLYQHFGDKEAIFREVIFARDTAIVDPPVVEPGDTLVSALHRTAHYSFDVALRSRSIELMRLMIAESARFPDLISKVANATFSRFKANVATVFRQLAENGVIPQGDDEQSAELFVDLLLGNRTVMIYFGWLSSPPSEEDIERKLDLFINGRFGANSMKSAPAKKPAAKRPAAKQPAAKQPAAKQPAAKQPAAAKASATKAAAKKPAAKSKG